MLVQVFGVFAGFLFWVSASGQTLQWHGHPPSWTAISDSVHGLSLSAPGSAWLYACPSGALGSSIRIDWSTTFSGSQNNYSSFHLFRLPPDVAPGDAALEAGPPLGEVWSFHIGASGANDGLEITAPSGGPTTLFHGDLAGPVNLSVGMDWPDGDSIMTLATTLAPDEVPLTPVDTFFVGPTAEAPQCVGWAATVTSSNLQGVQFALGAWGDWAPDTLPPVMLSAQLVALDTVVWTANEPLANNNLSHRLKEPLHPPATPGVPVWALSPAVADLAGNVRATGADSMQVVWTDPSLHGPGRVVFSEVLVDPTPSTWLPEAEWVEVVNLSPLAVQISDLHWFDTGSGLSEIQPLPPWDGTLFPGDRALLTTSESLLFPGTLQAYLPGGGSLSDFGDEIGLLCPAGGGDPLEWSDRVAWDAENWDGNGRNGRSWQRLHLGGCSGPANWRASSAPLGATPGAPGWLETPGHGPEPGEPFRSISLPRSPLEVEVRCSEPMDPWALERLPPGVTGGAAGPDSRLLHLSRSISPGPGSALRMSGLQRCFGTNRSVAWVWPETHLAFPEPGHIRITEIMSAPLAGSPGAPNEWVELHNLTGDSLELTGLKVNEHLPDERWFIPPDGRTTFHFPGPHDLPNASGEVVLQTAGGQTVDSVHYDPCFFSRKGHVGKGRSVVRTSAGWATSGSATGASPGTADPAEMLAQNASEDSALTWLLCGQTATDHLAVVLLSRTVTGVETETTTAWPLSGLLRGRAWVMDWPAEVVPWPDLVVHPEGEAAMVLQPPASCGVSTTEWAQIRLTEVLADTDVEPFIEVRSQFGTTASGSLALSAADDPWPPANRFPLTSHGVTWHLPAQQTWAFASCPNRLQTPNALPLDDMPSLWGNPVVSLLQEDGVGWTMADSVALGPHRHADWVQESREISLERCGAGSWTSSREVTGHTAGTANSTEGWCDPSSTPQASAELSAQVWRPGGAPLLIFWTSESSDCIPEVRIRDAWSLREIKNLGFPVPRAGVHNDLTWVWEGGTNVGSGVPPAGRYLVHLTGCTDQLVPHRWLPFVIRSP